MAQYTVEINLDQAEVVITLIDKFKVTIEESGFIGNALEITIGATKASQIPNTTPSYGLLALVDEPNNIYEFPETYIDGSVMLFYNGQQTGQFIELGGNTKRFKTLFVVQPNRQLTASHS
jgi:hypothetical protein